MALTIAIDGPAGAGKSTVASALAKALGVLHLDTGAMYRAVALKVVRAGLDPRDGPAVEALAAAADIAVAYEAGEQRTYLDGEDVTDAIRTPEISAAASAVSMLRGVRERMVALQRHYAAHADMVLDGRDIGTRVLPGATHKFFLTASQEVRAARRYEELRQKGKETPYASVLADLIARDKQDMERAEDPLRRAEDAREVDTTDRSEAEVVGVLLNQIWEETV